MGKGLELAKVGDLVKCINPSDYGIFEGRLYTIEYVGETGWYYVDDGLPHDQDQRHGWFYQRFVKASILERILHFWGWDK
jgi:hypothetical protein